MRGERGWALVAVLWALTMLALMAAATEALTVTSYRTEQHAIVEAQADAALDAAVVRAVLGISDLRSEMRWRVDGSHRTILYYGASIDVAVQDENGRIDLNTASGSLIRQLLVSAGLSGDSANALTDRIVSWRGIAGPQTLNGGSDEDYQAAGLSYLPRHGPFQTVDEVGLVLGVTPQLLARIRPALTVYSKQASFDSAVAPREALMVLYPDDPGKIDQIMQAREVGLNAATPLPPGQPGTAGASAGHAFSIAAATNTGARIFRRTAVVEITGDDRRPYFVLAWK